MLQLDTPEPATKTRIPGDTHIWVMVIGDLLIFTGYFVMFMVFRSMNDEAFLEGQRHLSVNIGVTNTVVLLTSSWFIARSVFATRAGNYRTATRFIYAGAAGGVLFVILKMYEWAIKISHGYTNAETFFSFYYVITGVHLVHVLIGLIGLGVCVRELKNPGRQRLMVIESGALYWHMVDLLWVVIFGLIYVMR